MRVLAGIVSPYLQDQAGRHPPPTRRRGLLEIGPPLEARQRRPNGSRAR